MIETQAVRPLTADLLEDIGMSWHTDADGTPYVPAELIPVTEVEAEAYYEAAASLYDMFVEAGQYVLDQNLLGSLGISGNLHELIRLSWDDDDWHLYGRFDLAGGIDGHPIKLIEFNADTPTGLFETAIAQWALLKANGLDEARQFNNLYESIRANFQRLLTEDHGLERFAEFYHGERILFSSVRGAPEDERTARLLQAMARDAGYATAFCYFDEAGFLATEGVFDPQDWRCPFWFKLWPWEILGAEEGELVEILTAIARERLALFLNPAYTLIFQSKGLLPILCQLFPDSPYLLPAASQPLPGQRQIAKPVFGREGANLALIEADGRVSRQTPGPYGGHPSIYQTWIDYPQDKQGQRYQAGVFYAWEPCALGFRRGGLIIDNGSKFVGHRVVT